MLLPLSWLKEFLPSLPTTEKLAELLMMHGLEVEEIIDRRQVFDKVIVGEIVGIRPHPNADKLRLADVVIVPNGKPMEIVCGAPNIKIGQKVPVAMLGAKLPNGRTIERRPIRGIESNGMLCAEDELGLGTSHSGIVILDPATKVGTPFSQAMGFDDVVLDLAIPANRSDLMSVRGLTREIAVMLEKTAKFPVPTTPRRLGSRRGVQGRTAKKTITVSVQTPKLCPVYTAQMITGVNVKPSPAWLQNRLRQAGMRPINTIVDATNYIMLEYGQPLHAFDAAQVNGGKIIVRPAQAGESLKTLDGQTRKLNTEMLVIADARGPIALAGVMGGEESEVSEKTVDVLLESAIFDPASIRHTSRKLGLVSEASKRFEKGLPASLPAIASQAATALIIKLAGGTAEGKLVSVGSIRTKNRTIRFDPAYVSERLGMNVPMVKAKTMLTKLGFKVTGGKTWTVTVPERRLDVTLPEDLVDEVGRMMGYDGLPISLPTADNVPGPLPKTSSLKNRIADVLTGLGFTETISHSYYGDRWARLQELGGTQRHYQVQNPLDETQQFLRRSFTPKIHEIINQSIDAGEDARVFEIGRVFLPDEGKALPDHQPWSLVVGVAFVPPKGYAPLRKVRGFVEELGRALGCYITPDYIDAKLIKGRIFEWWVINDIANFQPKQQIRFRELPKFPAVSRDISFWFPESKHYADLAKQIMQAGKPLLANIELDDVFVQENKRSLKIHCTFQAPDRTLTKEEIDRAVEAIRKSIRQQGGTIR